MKSVAVQASLQDVLNKEGVRKRFVDMLGVNASSFISSIITVYHNNDNLRKCSHSSILSAASTAAALKLPIVPSLNLAYVVPYKTGKDHFTAQFQLGWRGQIQLAMRTGQYKKINAGPVCEGQILDVDFITGDIIRGDKISDEIVGYVGYVAYIELINGFSKALFMTNEQLTEHAKKFSKAFAYDLKFNKKTSVWSTDFDAMAKKTVLKLLLGKFGIITIDDRNSELAVSLHSIDYVSESDIVCNVDEFKDIDTDTGEIKTLATVDNESPPPPPDNDNWFQSEKAGEHNV